MGRTSALPACPELAFLTKLLHQPRERQGSVKLAAWVSEATTQKPQGSGDEQALHLVERWSIALGFARRQRATTAPLPRGKGLPVTLACGA